jgi:hypothetical protein
VVVATRALATRFRVLQYKVLAKRYARNTEPWFLYGGLNPAGDAARAAAIAARHVEKDADGNYRNVGWPRYVRGILTEAEIAEVERRDAVFDFGVRGPRLVETIAAIGADLLSLVEVDEYDAFWRDALAAIGLSSVWHRRPREGSPDGCLVAYRAADWALEASHGFSFTPSGVGEQDRGALLALLRRRATGERVVFVSTHLARMNETDRDQQGVRLCQVASLVTELAAFAEREAPRGTPVVVCGDWNTTSLEEVRAVTQATCRLEGVAAHDILFAASDVPTPPTSITLLRKSKIDYIMFQEGLLDLRDSATTCARSASGIDALER